MITRRIAVVTLAVALMGCPPTAPPQNLRVVGDGNSIMAGWAAGTNPVTLVTTELGWPGIHGTNVAVSGQTTQQMLDRALLVVEPNVHDDQDTVVLALEVTNDLYFGASPRDAVDRLWEYCVTVRAYGPRVRVFAYTVLPRGNGDPTFEGRRLQANRHLRTEWVTYCDGLVDIAADPRLSDADDTTYFVDGVHPTALGTEALASLTASAMRRSYRLEEPPP